MVALVAPVVSITPAAAQDASQGQQAGALVTRLERTVGTLDNGQRDIARQVAESYVRDRGQNSVSATAQIENALRNSLSPGQFEKYQGSRDYVLNGTGPRPAAAQGDASQGQQAGALVTRLERTVGTLDNGQRDIARQVAESYVRDRGQNSVSATAQIENALRNSLSPGQFEKYQNRRDYVLNGGNRR